MDPSTKKDMHLYDVPKLVYIIINIYIIMYRFCQFVKMLATKSCTFGEQSEWWTVDQYYWWTP